MKVEIIVQVSDMTPEEMAVVQPYGIAIQDGRVRKMSNVELQGAKIKIIDSLHSALIAKFDKLIHFKQEGNKATGILKIVPPQENDKG